MALKTLRAHLLILFYPCCSTQSHARVPHPLNYSAQITFPDLFSIETMCWYSLIEQFVLCVLLLFQLLLLFWHWTKRVRNVTKIIAKVFQRIFGLHLLYFVKNLFVYTFLIYAVLKNCGVQFCHLVFIDWFWQDKVGNFVNKKKPKLLGFQQHSTVWNSTEFKSLPYKFSLPRNAKESLP